MTPNRVLPSRGLLSARSADTQTPDTIRNRTAVALPSPTEYEQTHDEAAYPALSPAAKWVYSQ